MSPAPQHSRHLRLPTEAATEAVARALAPRLAAGDTLLLAGPIGAGKTHFARALIRARLGRPAEEVPSPSFTLVQSYEAPDCEIWHADLYRLSDPAEVLELGLGEAFETAICLVEWPDRLGGDAPPGALRLTFSHGAGGEERALAVTGGGPLLDRVMPAATRA